ncbi:hypothetical protein PsAD2_01965 [Pseudovibrio axinellae]|uniref:DUF2339 domain-containing protein n=1 Tax=Pseudovibrio axinellae TaxID=989403 RepID=A0A165Z1C3_9HYPH|nr:DUF2339 domain-containing protein [Pseudovibrio axinellae]KZL19426.1 hypothetical protein PsAD2_01965 [Pseudovibrio axinellae]SER59521.1 Uncharacterized membrane protein [Pseudovibrio axinellae]
MYIFICAILVVFTVTAYSLRGLLLEISRKLNYLNQELKALNISVAELKEQTPQHSAAAPEESKVQEAGKTAAVSAAHDVVRSAQSTPIEAPKAKQELPEKETFKHEEAPQERKPEALEHAQAPKKPKSKRPWETPVSTQNSGAGLSPATQMPQKKVPHPAEFRPKKTPLDTWFGRVFKNVFENFKKNWVVWLGALSLGFGGIFFVQYGIENGILSPSMRVGCALAFGLALICGAEFARRKHKSQPVDPFGPLVAAASGGLATLFGATVGAYSLYGLIGPVTALIGLAVVSWLAIGGGLIYGPVLATIGILGAYYSPLLVSGAEPSAMLYLYFAMVLASSLAVERLQKWIWLSALSILSVFVWVFLLYFKMPDLNLTPVMLAAILVLTITVPAMGLPPKTPYSWWPFDKEFLNYKQTYPALLSYGVGALVLVLALYFTHQNAGLVRPMVLVFACLLVTHVFFLSKAESLDLMAPGLMFGFVIMLTGIVGNPWVFEATDQLYYLVLLAVVISVLTGGSLLRARHSVRPDYWHWTAIALPSLGALVYSVFSALQAPWLISPAGSFGYVFALGLQACIAVYLRKGPKKFELCVEGSSALAFLLVLPFSYQFFGEIMLPIAMMVGAVAVLELSDLFALKRARTTFYVFLSAAIFFTTQRYFASYESTTYADIAVLFLPVLFLSAVGWWRGNQRESASEAVVFETTAWAALSVLACALLNVFYDDQAAMPRYVDFGSYALIFAVQVCVQLKRMTVSTSFPTLRTYLFFSYWGLMLFTSLMAILLNPLYRSYVFGYIPVDSLSIAYLYPAVAMLVATERYWGFKEIPQNITRAVAGVLLVLFVGLEIRAFWQGSVLSAQGVMLEELYSYTVAMLIFSVGLISVASVKQRKRVGQVGLAFIGVTCLKVFFIDMSGLYGLARATSFIGLGLTLVGIAWANNRFLSFSQQSPANEEPDPQPQ